MAKGVALDRGSVETCHGHADLKAGQSREDAIWGGTIVPTAAHRVSSPGEQTYFNFLLPSSLD